ncbi:MAG TPA: hypothetical protein PK812_03505 [Beijerinckiaceae bacterium]|nr:hypothetical protein [Beijerinckiaceae bacterium]
MRLSIAVAALAASVLAASAHEPRKGPNGGTLVDAGKNHHLELVAKGTEEVVVFLSDADDKPVSAAGFRANAILVVGGKPQRFALEPAEGSRLVGRAPVAVPAGTKGAVQLTGPDGATAQAKF